MARYSARIRVVPVISKVKSSGQISTVLLKAKGIIYHAVIIWFY